MKVYLLGGVAMLLAATVWAKLKDPKSEESKFYTPAGYYIYNKSGPETSISSYTHSVAIPTPCPLNGPNLCWILIHPNADTSGDGNISQTEFYNYVHTWLDANQNNILHDDPEIPGRLEKTYL